MKIRAAEIVIGYRLDGYEVISIARGVGGLFVMTTKDHRDRWYRNDQQIDVNDR